MGVASHLGIDLTEYDSRIRTFIPHYEQMLDVAAAAIPPQARTIVELGVGTGALSFRCLKVAPAARAIGIDVDPEILALARRRLGERATFGTGSFLRTPISRCDALVASFALHHVRTRAAKKGLYRRIGAALRPGGVFLNVDCQPAHDVPVRRAQFDEWLAHLRRSYTAAQARAIFTSWSHEDVYVPLDDEIALMRSAGLRVELLWRRGAFAVIRAARSFQTKIA
jgi:ubiquinone/menaquinone biosynthesis C-methylase UbiE